MLAVDKNYRKRRIGMYVVIQSCSLWILGVVILGSTLVKEIIRQMIIEGCDEVRFVLKGCCK